MSVQFAKDKRRILTSRRSLLRGHEEASRLADAAIERLSTAESVDEVALAKAKENAAAEQAACAAFRTVIADREKDDRFTITVKRIGASDDGKTFDPSVGGERGQLAAMTRKAVHAARRRAKQWLQEQGLNIDEAAVTQCLNEDPQWVKDSGDALKAHFVAGIVNGESEWQRIYDLGFETGGPDRGSSFLRQAVEEIEDFNTISAEKKSV